MKDNFFDDFFGDSKPASRECVDCGSTADLEVLHAGGPGGSQTWICRKCHQARRQAADEHGDQMRAAAERADRRDRYEEKKEMSQ